jgi:hypothetical protein
MCPDRCAVPRGSSSVSEPSLEHMVWRGAPSLSGRYGIRAVAGLVSNAFDVKATRTATRISRRYAAPVAARLVQAVGRARAAPTFRRHSGRHHRGDTRDTNHVRDRPIAAVRSGPGTAHISPPAAAPERRRRAGSASGLHEAGRYGYALRRLRDIPFRSCTRSGPTPPRRCRRWPPRCAARRSPHQCDPRTPVHGRWWQARRER